MNEFYKCIIRQCSNIKALKSLKNAKNELSEEEKWIHEHRFRLLCLSKTTLDEIKELKRILRESELKRLVKLSEKIILTNAYSVSEDGVVECVERFQSENENLTIAELGQIKTVISMLLFDAIGERIRSNEETGVTVPAIKLLYQLDDIDFEEIYIRVSKTEELLLSDPSGVYEKCDVKTKQMYRRKLSEISRRERKSEFEVLDKYLKLSFDNGGDPKTSHVGYYIMKDSLSKRGDLYFKVLDFLPLTIVLTAAAAAGNFICLLFLLLAYFPLRNLTKLLINDLVARRSAADILPRVKFDEIPNAGKTILLYTTIFTDAEKDKYLFCRLSNYARAYKDKNLIFAVLFDFSDSDVETEENDKDIVDFAKREIDKINSSGGQAVVFYRPRKYSETERKYIGRDRKRGAQEDLIAYLKGEKNDIICYGVQDFYDAKYILALDSDTEIVFEDIKTLIATALHPYNAPRYEKRADRLVTADGYGVLQPKTVVSLKTADLWNKYTLLKNAFEGRTSYEDAAYSLYSALFGVGCYTGKGLINIESYYLVLRDLFPEGSILSHDIAEGLFLRCGFASDVEIYDSPPKNYLSERKRAHRWMRGDVQSLSLSKKELLGNDGIAYKNPLNTSERRILREPIFEIALDIFRFVGVAAALFLEGADLASMLVLMFSDQLYVLAKNLISMIKIPRRRYLSGIPSYHMAVLFEFFFRIISVFDRFALATDALFRALYRIYVSRRKLLEWTVFSLSDMTAKESILGYTSALKANAVLGILSITLSLFLYPFRYSLFIFGSVFLLFPFVMFALNKISERSEKHSSQTDRCIKKDVENMWNYFSEYVNKKYNNLPPDNVTLFPKKNIAERTSPTNIGMYLISLINAFDFGIIGSDELYLRLESTVATLEKMEKWNGHLYNWYDINDLRVLQPAYVSTVDSGNLVVSLVVVKNALLSHGVLYEKLIGRISKLVDQTKFSELYNEKRNLFYIGYDQNSRSFDKNLYDLFASEMLTTSFFAVATGQIGKSHLSALGKLYEDHGNTSPILSWSGSAFEYFMPSIFLPCVKKSERGEMLASAAFCQMQNSSKVYNKTIWGVSESSYYDFNDEMSYAYKAHGVKKTALSHESEEKVYAPYALYLMLGYGTAAETLENLRETELYGMYGFYDSVDLERKRVGGGYGITKIYMAHHIGMSIAAAANYLLNGINVKRFCADPAIRSSIDLLFNKIEICRPKTDSNIRYARREALVNFVSEGEIQNTGTAVLSNGRCKIVGNDKGNVAIYCDSMLIFQNSEFGFSVFLEVDGRLVDILRSDGIKDRSSTDFSYDGASISYKTQIITGEGLGKIEILFMTDPLSAKVEIRLVTNNLPKDSKILVFALPVLSAEKDYLASPSYSDLFVSSGEENDRVIYDRNNNSSKMQVLFDGNAPERIWTRMPFEMPFNYKKSDLMRLFLHKQTDDNGNIARSILSMLYRIEQSGELRLSLMFDDNAPESSFSELHNRAKKHFYLNAALSGISFSDMSTISRILSAVANNKRQMTVIDGCRELSYGRDILWRHSVSGDLPIITVYDEKGDDISKMTLEGILRAKRFLFISGIRFDLLIVYNGVGYYNDNKKSLSDLLVKYGCGSLINKNNGVFLIDNDSLSERERIIITALSSDVFDLSETGFCEYIKPEKAHHKGVSKEKAGDHEICYLNGTEVHLNNFGNSHVRTMIYANSVFGTMLTNKTCGFSYYKNSSLGLITKRHIDPLNSVPGELIELIIDNEKYDLAASSDMVLFTDSCAVYRGSVDRIEYELSVGVDAKYPIKLYHLSFKNLEELQNVRVELTLYMPSSAVFCSDGTINILGDFKTAVKIFSVFDGADTDMKIHSDSVTACSKIKDGKCGFVVAAAAESSIRRLTNVLYELFDSEGKIKESFVRYDSQKRGMLTDQAYNGANKWLSEILSMSAYQALYYRMIARCGYSQPGGAYGFRDQLQDSLSALYYEPNYTKLQIIRSAAHQYNDGRVQHWWHSGVGGIKTRCSDDYMWLPYAVSEYITATGDVGILDLKIPYLVSPPLSENESDRYENPMQTKEKFTLYDHVMRSVNASLERGAHGLPLMLDGDWNDGMNKVGHRGRGESVWLGFFFALTYRKLADAIILYGECYKSEAERLYKMSNELLDNIEASSWGGEWYIRAFDDDGIPIGSDISDECKIDAIPQAFSVFAKADKCRTETAMRNVKLKLYDEKNGILRLFAPSFDKIKKYGYICSYPPGVRENGGQYTHAAIWAAMAFFEIGDHKTGLDIMRSVSPNDIYKRGAMNGRYTAEPYLICADIYYGDGITGTSGWSGYTCSAAWYYRCAMKYILGVTPYMGGFKIKPPEYINDNYFFKMMYRGHEISFFVDFMSERSPKDYDITAVIKRGEEFLFKPEGKNFKILVKVLT